MTKQTYILIGCPGVGKSTYTKQFPASEVFSSDKTRFKLFHTLDASVQTPAHHQQVFKVLQDDLVASEAPINIYDATNLTRNFRFALYQRLQANDHHVTAVVFTRPLATIQRQNRLRPAMAQVPDEVIYRFYCSFEPPRIGMDCDAIEVIGDFTSFQVEMGDHYRTSMEQPGVLSDQARLTQLTDFLAAGQAMCAAYEATVTQERPQEAHYAGNVASYYYLAYLHEHQHSQQTEALDNVELLYQHTQTPSADTPRSPLSDHPLAIALVDQWKGEH